MCKAKTVFGYLFNFVFWLSGATLIAIGTYVTIDVGTYIDLIGKECISVALAFIGVGCLAIICSIIGGISVSSEHRIWINIYMVLIWIVLLLEISGAITTVLLQDKIANRTEQQLNTTIWSYDHQGSDDLTKEWDSMQKTVECCGATTFTEWFEITTNIPSSCCISGTHCSVNNDTDDPRSQIFTDDCVHKVSDLLELYALIVWSSGFCGAFVTMVGIVIFCCLRLLNTTCCCAAKTADISATNA